MNKEQILNLAEKYGARHGDLCDYDLSFEFTRERLLAFANACCDVQRESDAKICEADIECSAAGFNDGKPWLAKRDTNGLCAAAIRNGAEK